MTQSFTELTGCPYCTVRLVNPAGLDAHIAEHHPVKPQQPAVFVPAHAPPTFPTHLSGNWEGDNQGAVISPPNVPAKLAPDPLACPQCQQACKNLAGLKAHIRTKHGNPESTPPPAA